MKKVIIILSATVIIASGCSKSYPESAKKSDLEINISPDYTGITIPYNIAPLNFRIKHKAKNYAVKLHSPKGKPVVITSNTDCISIPAKPWKRLLEENKGSPLYVDISVNDSDGNWISFKTINNYIAAEPIDSHIAYRKIQPIYNYWANVSIYDRCLEDFNENAILEGKRYGNSCVNCHSFNSNDPETLFMGIRSSRYGSHTILAKDKQAQKIPTKWGYTSWHPSGRLAAYSINKVRMFYHSTRNEVRDVVDLDSAIVYYSLKDKEVRTNDQLSDKERLETYPAWSPDGKYLYYCSAPILWEDKETVPPANYNKVRYDLRRIPYDINTDTWGQYETLIKAEDVNKTILLPRISPDGKFIIFCMCDYGCFPVYSPSSDLYIMNLENMEYSKLDINSKYSESWHSFSSNSRWIVFSSKRINGSLTRSYFSYLDKDGKVYKPFVLPQKDPAYYESCLYTYNVPEIITGPVPISQPAIAAAIRTIDQTNVKLPLTGATQKVDHTSPWKDRE